MAIPKDVFVIWVECNKKCFAMKNIRSKELWDLVLALD